MDCRFYGILLFCCVVGIFGCSKDSDKVSGVADYAIVSASVLLANGPRFDGRGVEIFGHLHGQVGPDGEHRFWILPSSDYGEYAIPIEYLDNLAIRLQFDDDDPLPLPESCIGEFVFMLGTAEFYARRVTIHTGETGAIWALIGRGQVDCRPVQ